MSRFFRISGPLARIARRSWIGLIGAGILAAGCSSEPTEQPAAFTVAAAASLSDVVSLALERWNEAHQGQRGSANFAGSSTLAQQVIRGARFELFLSADENWMNEVRSSERLVPDSTRLLAQNRLVLIEPNRVGQHTLEIKRGAPLPERFVGVRWSTGDVEHVPIGRYAHEALSALGWWDRCQAHQVVTQDVRSALRLVERDSVDWGIVYRTDAERSHNVSIVGEFPADLHATISYRGALTTPESPAARAFLDWLSGPDGRALFKQHAFAAPASGDATSR